jgi:hypothetical protein
MPTDFYSNRIQFVTDFLVSTFPMHSTQNALSKMLLKNGAALLRIRTGRFARNLGNQGTWLAIRPADSYVDTLPHPQLANT